MSNRPPTRPRDLTPSPALPSKLAPAQRHFIDLFVAAAEVLGIPRSMGEIYGVIFASTRPLTFQGIVEQLGLSKGSVSQGLKTLRGIGAVRATYVPGDRRDYFEAETELRHLVSGLLRDRINPHLEHGRQRLQTMRQQVDAGDGLSSEDSKILESRIAKLESWRKQGSRLLPLISKVLA